MSKRTPHPLTGLVPAALTPLDSAGELNLAAVEQQAGLLLADGVSAVFVGGTTGEFSSLTVAERKTLAGRWLEVARGTQLRVVVHVGANSLPDAGELAAHAGRGGAAAIAAVAPSYFKPRTTRQLAEWCAGIAKHAPQTPFYFYDIPSMTGVSLPMPEFLRDHAGLIPSLAGLKFTNPDLMALQQLFRIDNGRFDVVWGFDEYLLAALVLGAEGAVGSTYNFAAPLYRRIIGAVKAGDLAAARADQFRSVQLLALMHRSGFLAAAKEVMRVRGIDLGPIRMPNQNFTADQAATFRRELDELEFAGMIRA
ncbi:MAG: nanA [Gemmataceae bacterium]|nr:nanA [Gemmataceae bacterium]